MHIVLSLKLFWRVIYIRVDIYIIPGSIWLIGILYMVFDTFCNLRLSCSHSVQRRFVESRFVESRFVENRFVESRFVEIMFV